MKPNAEDQVVVLLFIAVFVVMLFYRRRWRPSANGVRDGDLDERERSS